MGRTKGLTCVAVSVVAVSLLGPQAVQAADQPPKFDAQASCRWSADDVLGPIDGNSAKCVESELATRGILEKS